jgi:hypothetical protein
MARIENSSEKNYSTKMTGDYDMLEGFDFQTIIDGLLAQIVELITGVLNDLLGNLFSGLGI